MSLIYRGEDLADYLKELFETNKGDIGLSYITTDDTLIPEYPAAIVIYDRTERVDHTTHYFKILISCDIIVLHAALTEDRQERKRSDYEMVTKMVALLHDDRTLGGRVLHSHVPSEEPGTAETANDLAVSTRITFVAEQREAFK